MNTLDLSGACRHPSTGSSTIIFGYQKVEYARIAASRNTSAAHGAATTSTVPWSHDLGVGRPSVTAGVVVGELAIMWSRTSAGRSWLDRLCLNDGCEQFPPDREPGQRRDASDRDAFQTCHLKAGPRHQPLEPAHRHAVQPAFDVLEAARSVAAEAPAYIENHLLGEDEMRPRRGAERHHVAAVGMPPRRTKRDVQASAGPQQPAHPPQLLFGIQIMREGIDREHHVRAADPRL